MKKIISLLCAFLILFSCVSIMPLNASAADIVDSGTCGENLTWTLSSNGELTISGTGNMASYNSAERPWSRFLSSIRAVVIDDGVTSISDGAFIFCENIKNVSFPESLNYIGIHAFRYCEKLTYVSIPKSVTFIGEQVFQYCLNLQYISVDVNNPNYCNDFSGVLYNKKMTTLMQAPGAIAGNYTVPDSVTAIDAGAFSCCNNLARVVIGNNVSMIEAETFENCSSLTNILIGNNVLGIGDDAFNGCTNLKSVIIPNSVTNIGCHAFHNCSSLSMVIIPNSVITIDNDAFYLCNSLLSVTIPDSVTTISNSTFGGCYNLTSMTIPDSITSIGDYAFQNCDSLTNVYYSGTEHQWSAISIGSENDPLLNATIHYNSTGAGEIIDSGTCGDNLTWVLDSEGTLTISGTGDMNGETPWSNHKDNIIKVVVNEGVTSIYCHAFDVCANLTDMYLPATMTRIDVHLHYYAGACTYFCGAPKLNGIWVAEGNPAYFSDEYGVLFDGVNHCLMRAPSTLCGEYTVPAGISEIGFGAFCETKGITAVRLPDSVKKLGIYAFSGCRELESINLENLTQISGWALCSCKKLENVTLSDGLEIVNEAVFMDCEGLTSITIPASVTTIDLFGFYRCKNLKDVYYGGTQDQWENITILGEEGLENSDGEQYRYFLNAAVYYTYDPAAEATAGTNCYMTLEEALFAAQAGDTVKLLQDVQMDEIILTDGVIIDLNGYTLTTEAFTGYAEDLADGCIIDSSAGNTGLLVVEKETAVFKENNPDLPLYDTENGGYRFFDYQLELHSGTTNVGEGKEKFWFKFHFYTDDTCAELDSDAYGIVLAGNSGMEVGTSLTWKGKALSPVRFVKNSSADAFSQAWAKGATAARWFYITVNGLDKVEDGVLTVAPQITANGVIAENGKITYVKGDLQPDYGWSEGGPAV